MARSLDEAPFLNIFDPEFLANPVTAVAELRRQSSVIRTPIGVLVVGRSQVQDLLRDRTLHGSLLHVVRLQGINDGPVFQMAASSLLAKEGEEHNRIRRLVARSFTPRAADGHRPFMRELVTELLGGFAERGECEFMADFADHYPVQVIAHLLGVPREDHPLFAEWGNSLTHLLSFELSKYRGAIETAQAAMSAYLADLVADRRQHPRSDLVSDLIAARAGGDRLTDPELMSLLGGLLFAGYDTTRNQLAVGMTIFARLPEQWARLATDPSVAPQTVEEVMRLGGVVSVIPRVATSDIQMGEWTVPAGTLVSLSLAGANHDPSVYPKPNRFDPDAPRPDPHLGFGGGPHHCLGASLARAEMQEALPLLAAAMPDMTVAAEPAWRSPLVGIHGPLQLNLRFTRRVPALR
jgi:cytochrome P450